MVSGFTVAMDEPTLWEEAEAGCLNLVMSVCFADGNFNNDALYPTARGKVASYVWGPDIGLNAGIGQAIIPNSTTDSYVPLTDRRGRDLAN